jgi:hypothetical protein
VWVLNVLPHISHTSSPWGIFSRGSSGTGGAFGIFDMDERILGWVLNEEFLNIKYTSNKERVC